MQKNYGIKVKFIQIIYKKSFGVITSPISEIDKLSGSFDVKIELDN